MYIQVIILAVLMYLLLGSICTLFFLAMARKKGHGFGINEWPLVILAVLWWPLLLDLFFDEF